MLVVSRHMNEFVDFYTFIDGTPVKIGELTIVDIRGDKARIGFDFPRDIKIVRREVPVEPQTQGLRNEADETNSASQPGQGLEGPPSRQAKAAGLIAQVQAVARRRIAAGQAAGTSEAGSAGAATGGAGCGEGSGTEAA